MQSSKSGVPSCPCPLLPTVLGFYRNIPSYQQLECTPYERIAVRKWNEKYYLAQTSYVDNILFHIIIDIFCCRSHHTIYYKLLS